MGAVFQPNLSLDRDFNEDPQMSMQRLFILVLSIAVGSATAFAQSEARSLRDQQIQQRLELLESDIRFAVQSHRRGRALEPERLKGLELRLESLFSHAEVTEGPGAELASRKYASLQKQLEVLEQLPRQLNRKRSESFEPRGWRVGTEGVGNDSCASATAISLGELQGDTTGAASDGEVSCGSWDSPALWYRFVAPSDGGYFFGTEYGSMDSVLSIFDSCPGNQFSEIACSDYFDTGDFDWASGIDLDLQSGDEIWIRVSGSWDDESGPFTLVSQLATGLSGQVTFDPATQDHNSTISVLDSSGDWITDEYLYDGNTQFRFYALEPGTYHVLAESYSYVSEWYDDVACLYCWEIKGTPIEVVAGQVTRNIDIELSLGGTIEGRLTKQSNGQPLDGCVSAWSSDGRLLGEDCAYYEGMYSIEQIPEGGTYLMVSSHWTGLPAEIYDGITCTEPDCDPTLGDPVQAVNGETTSDIDFVLDDSDTCLSDEITLCVSEGSHGSQPRFRISGSVATSQGGGFEDLIRVATPWGSGGLLYFLNRENPEILVKILDGCVLNQHFWVFYAAATNLGFELTIEDLERGVSKTYRNPDQTDAVTVTDTSALGTCP